MTQAQLEVLNIIRANPYFCRNELELRYRTRIIKQRIDDMIPRLEKRISELGPLTEDNEPAALDIMKEEMTKLLKGNYNAIIVKADTTDKNLAFIHQGHQAYLIYYFLTNSINPYMATLSVDPEGIISFYNPPAVLLDATATDITEEPLNKDISKQLCDILLLPKHLLEVGPLGDHYQEAS